jgi:hypothetical protein
MFFRDVLKRRRASAGDTATTDGGVANACPRPLSLVEELAADPEDFVDVAAVLRVDVPTLVAALTAPTTRAEPSWGGGGKSGWGRCTRAYGDARVHREDCGRKPVTAARPALAAP